MKKGGHKYPLGSSERENELQIEIEKEKKDPVMDESILSDIVLTSPFLQNSNSLMTRIRPGGIGTIWERWFEIVRHKLTERTALLHTE